ncbi:hypothetical protein PPTG_21983 [Phytophthora nicotianae INRA-310]|uniref:Uncharacterized protein n=1 Tax=Phytophthora nicotianae (strain INRA-310) TaxID=761204 RepID=W2QRX1_PHYN3|nr:hypothetical protein PPTG_21983 [Phytophthora nicotianae INRA-310]ETN15701.1 hypothetical protein PPTG_21983 [Phytophthora nicotianae INRA-310]
MMLKRKSLPYLEEDAENESTLSGCLVAMRCNYIRGLTSTTILLLLAPSDCEKAIEKLKNAFNTVQTQFLHFYD